MVPEMADMRALGKSLQASHERQMVRMAKLLHSLETLAEEAERSEDERRRREHEEDGAPLSSIEQGGGGGGGDDNHGESSRREEEEVGESEEGLGDNNDNGVCGETIRVTEAELATLRDSPGRVWDHIGSLRRGGTYGQEDVKRILRAASGVLRGEPSLIDLTERTERGGGLKTVTVVGDLHGHFEDSLVKVLDMVGGRKDKGKSDNDDDDDDGQVGKEEMEHGSPWDGTGAVVFNGDFVDRGKNSLEVILALLLLKLAYPDNVYLNRGNHEDSVIATVYGCSEEVQARYEGADDIWKEFEDVFASLPLAVKTDTAAIMHGGLPTADFKLEQIAAIEPEDRFEVKTMVEPGANETLTLMQNVMWSDPQPDEGVCPNEDRGCGVRYGPDVVRKFLADHNLRYLIRSHEPVDAGYELLECDEHGMSAVTVFSAASYPGGAGFNYGAIVRLPGDGGDVAFDSYGESDDDDGANHGLTAKEKMSHTFKAFADVVASNRAPLEEEFAYLAGERARRMELQMRFKFPTLRNDGEPNGATTSGAAALAIATSAATASNGPAVLITPEQWADAMKHVLGHELPNVDWLNVRKFIAPGELVDYVRFLNLHCSLSSYDQSQGTGMDDHTRDTILRNHDAIFKVFKFLDVDNDGEVDRTEFCRGIDELKKRNSDSALSFDAETLFDSIDVDGSGTIELSEFQHAFQACDVPYHVAVMMTLDEDKSGTIDRQEFRDGVRLLNARLEEEEKIPAETDEEVNRLFDELDESGDGELDIVEFEKFIRDYYPH